MPIYEYRRGKNTHRIISSVAFHKSLNSRLQDLDPRYDRMADAAAASTAEADPNRFLKSAIPLDAAED